MKKIILVLFLVFALMAQNAYTQNETAKKIDELLIKYSEMSLFSGTVLVAKQGNTIYKKAFGYADMGNKIPNEIDTRFNLCSIGKTFTAVLIMQLVESGKLNLTEPIATYLPEYKIPNSDKITIHHLLTHTSGLSNYMEHPKYQNSRSDFKNIDDVMKLVADQKLRFESPGEKMSYSNSGFVVLGKILEKISGKKYGDYLKEKILIPLNMTNTILPENEKELTNVASGHIISMDRKAVKNNIYVPAFSDGGLHTTIEDMLKYDQALYGTDLLKDETKDLMFAGGKENLEKYKTSYFSNYSYGWEVEDVNGRRVISHGGGIEGINAIFGRFPADKISIIILANFDEAADRIIKNMVKVVFGENPNPIKLPLPFFIYDKMKEKGINYFYYNFDEIIKTNDYKINNESILNRIGYSCLQENLIDEAIVIFKINVRLYPEIANCYDSLGEAYLKKGDKENAKINYKKAFELDPNNKNAEEILKTLK